MAQRATRPYSQLPASAPRCAAEDGSIHAGANVENAAYPQGQCAEASAIGAMVAGGGTQVAEVAVIAATARSSCVPVRRLPPAPARVRRRPTRRSTWPPTGRAHTITLARAAAAVVRAGVPRRDDRRGDPPRAGVEPRLGIVLGSGLGELADALERRASTIPYAELPGFPAAGVAGHAGALVLGTLGGIAGRRACQGR